MSQRPVVAGLHLCEQIIVDSKTRNVTPVNCFTNLRMESAADEQSFWVFAVLTDGQGTMQGTIDIERLDTGETVLQKEFQIRLQSPLQQLRLMLRIRSLGFPGAGAYQIMLKIDSELVASRRFILTERQDEP